MFRLAFIPVFLGFCMCFSILTASAQSEAAPTKSIATPLFLKDITGHPAIGELYKEMSKTGEINSKSFGESSLFRELEALGSDPNSARFFFYVCSGRVPYTSDRFSLQDFEALIEAERLSQALQNQRPTQDHSKLKALIIRASADSFYCGSEVQLSFALEDALEETSHLSEQTCASELRAFTGKREKYEAVLFKYIDYKKYENFERTASVKDVIVEALTSSFLCKEE